MGKVVLASTRGKNPSSAEISKALSRAIDLSDFDFSDKIRKVFIKPNLCYYWDSSTGETTDPRVVSSLIDHIRTQVSSEVRFFIAEADASAMKTKFSFKILGYEKLCRKKKGVELVNLSDGDILQRSVRVRNRVVTIPINKLLSNTDLLINVPKLKTHNVAGITCSLKNMFGAIAKPRKYVYHKILPQVIVAANKLMKSDLVIVDGIVARGSRPKKLGLLMVGDNPLVTDSVAAKVAGFNSNQVQHLTLAAKEELGNTGETDLVEDSIGLAKLAESFPRYNYSLRKLSWKLQLRLLKTYAKVVGDVIPPVLEQ
jgi:uncharacterized protein (DUF362 family)